MGQSRAFNGTTDYLDAGAAANCVQTTPLTLAAVIKLDSLAGGVTQAVMCRYAQDTGYGWRFNILPTTGVWGFTEVGVDDGNGTSTTAISTGVWTGIGIVITGTGPGSTVHLVRHVLGTGVTTTEDTTMWFQHDPSSGTQHMTIGCWYTATPVQFPFGGSITRCAVWSGVALTDDELKAWFCNETVKSGADGVWVLHGSASPEPDSSGNGYDMTVTGATAGSDPDACPGGPIALSGGAATGAAGTAPPGITVPWL